MASWVVRHPKENSILVDLDANLKGMLPVGVNLYFWGRAQMDSECSLMNALTRMVGIYFYADGDTLGMPIMKPYVEESTGYYSSDGENRWWILPHPLQAMDAINSISWCMLGASDCFKAAAGVPPWCPISYTM